jgi:hypothetical protein
MPASRRGRRGDAGTGLIATAAGVTVLLLLLGLAAQVLLALYATSVVNAAAYDAARRVAVRGGDAAALPDADAHLRRLLGGLAERATVEWALDPDVVSVRVRARGVALGGHLGRLGTIDRTARVRLECFREDGRCR